jgi:predicted ribonuclease YlaK
MKHSISVEHKRQFEEIKRGLATIGAKEGNFIKIELLFYEAISVAREYGDDVDDNRLLAALKQLQQNQYQETKALFNKSIQRERVIRRFIGSFRTVLTAGIRDAFFQPQLT